MVEDGSELRDEVKPEVGESKGLNRENMTKVENVKKAEAATRAMQEDMAEATLKTERSSRSCWMDAHQRRMRSAWLIQQSSTFPSCMLWIRSTKMIVSMQRQCCADLDREV